MSNSAPQSLLGNAWLSNANRPVEGTINPTWSGAVGVSEHQADSGVNPQRGGPPSGGYDGTSSPFAAEYQPDPLDAGLVLDTTFLEGHEAPWPEAGSNNQDFGYPGALPDLHSRDQGQYAAMQPRRGKPDAPGYFYAQVPGQSYDSQAQVTDNAGWNINKTAPMRSSWQRSGQVLPDYQTTNWVPSVEQPYHAQLAQGPTVIMPGTPLGPSGQVPDMSQMYDGTTVAATPPPPPSVPTSVPLAQAYEPGGEFL